MQLNHYKNASWITWDLLPRPHPTFLCQLTCANLLLALQSQPASPQQDPWSDSAWSTRWVAWPFGGIFSISAYPKQQSVARRCSSRGRLGSAPWPAPGGGGPRAPALPPRSRCGLCTPLLGSRGTSHPQTSLQGFPAAKCTPLQRGWARNFIQLKGKKLAKANIM